MRTEPLTTDEAMMILKRSMSFTEGRTAQKVGYNLELAEVPRNLAQQAFLNLDDQGRVPTNDALADELVELHSAFLKSASEEDRQRCFLRKAISHSESVDSNKKWEEHFASEIEKEFEVPGEIGEIAMQKTSATLGSRWTDDVVEAALLNIRQFKNNSSAPAP
ncbi:hypothetical protein [Sulfitobacter sp. R18_1]|uniref:hypothetical protein n=1 Tax=Sulfitobacter sp. R18_1 TaxID=2821104 RepID=UPI001AD988F4|nr:hypothetical protein [Sulfitobacter sp. R18_1]MBO9428042.1 hypothetical protein [Sulfitobacter sp. R18_1]